MEFRKSYLIILLGMFLISFASATITVSVNTTRPIFDVALVEDDGTELLEANTNYYFQCVVGAYGYN